MLIQLKPQQLAILELELDELGVYRICIIVVHILVFSYASAKLQNIFETKEDFEKKDKINFSKTARRITVSP